MRLLCHNSPCTKLYVTSLVLRDCPLEKKLNQGIVTSPETPFPLFSYYFWIMLCLVNTQNCVLKTIVVEVMNVKRLRVCRELRPKR